MKKGKGRAAAAPVWLTRDLLDTIHTDLIERYGGLHGIADAGLVDSAMARPANLLAYRPGSDLPVLAASLGYGLAKNHGYRDGNKRTAFVAMAVFLQLNGLWLEAPEPEGVAAMIYVATDAWDESKLSDWLRRSSRPGT
ncbi:MAG: type II toxin-antitoxin system death-on-curing family toxin [Gemmatimonadota bacterium]